jgi:RHS repeat-associated protein
LSFTYDALGRNLTQVGPQGTLSSIWDIGGRRTRITHPDSFYVDQDYLVTGELQKIRENGATSGVGVLATYAYDDLGRRTSLTLGDGSSTSYSYDNVSRLSQLVHDLSGTSYDQTLGFSYNPASEITQNTRSNDSYAWTGHYNVNRGYTANGLNQYTASGSVTPTYDTKGNLTSAGSTTYTYSSENLLTSASGGITLNYDPAMRLYQTAGGTPGTTRFAYDGTDLIAEYNSSNSLQRRYVHGSATDQPLVWYEGSGTSDRRFLHTDERGSVVSVTSGSGTTINTYDEYGIPRSSNTGRFQYTGQTWLPELGMYYYKARIYSPTLGRFLQTDPIGLDGGMSLYAYVGNNPTNRRDPNGKQALVGCAIGAGISALDMYTKGDNLFTVKSAESLLIDCATGAIGAGIASKVLFNPITSSLFRRAFVNGIVGGALGVGNAVAKSKASGGSLSPGSIISGGVAGALTGGLSSSLGEYVIGKAVIQDLRDGTYLVDSSGKAMYKILPESLEDAANVVSGLVGANVVIAIHVIDAITGEDKTIWISNPNQKKH